MRRITTWFHLFALACFSCVLGLVADARGGSFQTESRARLTANAPLDRSIGKAERHAYDLTLAAGQYVRVTVEQRGADVALSWAAPDGKQQFQSIDDAGSTEGMEVLAVIATATGDFHLTVESVGTGSGRYVVTVESPRQPTATDQRRAGAYATHAAAVAARREKIKTSLETARAKFLEALPVWKELGDDRFEGHTLYGLGDVLLNLGDNRKAIDYFERALPLRRTLGDRGTEAATLKDLGLTYNYLGEYPKALARLGEAEKLYRALDLRRGLAGTLNIIGIIHSNIGDHAKALARLEPALTLYRELGDESGQGTVLSNLGLVYFDRGRYGKAFECYTESLVHRRAAKDRRGEAYTLTNLGFLLGDIGQPRKALDHLLPALAMRRETGDRRGEATTLDGIAFSYSRLGETDKEHDYRVQAIDLYRATGERRGEAVALTNLGLFFLRKKDFDKALDTFEQALKLRREVANRRGEGLTLAYIGRTYIGKSEPRRALDYFKQGLTILEGVADPSGQATAWQGLATAKRDLGNLGEARADIEKAIELLEYVRKNVGGREAQTSYFAVVQPYYDLYIDILMRLHREHPREGFDALAFQVSERSHARALLELLTEAKADIRQGVDVELLESERRLKRQFAEKAENLTRLLTGKPNEAQIAAARREVEQLASRIDEIEATIRATAPRYANLTQPRPLTVAETQRLLGDDGTVLLEFALGAERSWAWLIEPTGITAYELPGRNDIETKAQRYVELLTARQPRPGETQPARRARIAAADTAYADAALALGRLLFGPIADRIEGKRLLVVPDGALHYVSMAPLPLNGPGRYVIDSNELVVLPSASALAALRTEAPDAARPDKRLAVIADPVFMADDPRLGGTSGPSTGSSGAMTSETVSRMLIQGPADAPAIPRLPFTRAEADRITRLAGDDTFKALDLDANRTTALGSELARYQYVHFATHGYLDSEYPELSALVFSLVDGNKNQRDGFVRLFDLFNLKLTADLVVLSACQTGLGKEVRGEGMVGLTRGFFYAGAKRVTVSLWNVSDRATADLMATFYSGMLKDGKRPAAALREAQRAMSRDKRWSHPFYWAAFQLHGEWR